MLINRNIQLIVMRQNEQDRVKRKVYFKCYDDVVIKILMIVNNQNMEGFDWSIKRNDLGGKLWT